LDWWGSSTKERALVRDCKGNSGRRKESSRRAGTQYPRTIRKKDKKYWKYIWVGLKMGDRAKEFSESAK